VLDSHLACGPAPPVFQAASGGNCFRQKGKRKKEEGERKKADEASFGKGPATGKAPVHWSTWTEGRGEKREGEEAAQCRKLQKNFIPFSANSAIFLAPNIWAGEGREKGKEGK